MPPPCLSRLLRLCTSTLILYLGLGGGAASGQIENPTPVTVVSAASFQPNVAPDSLVSIFGTQLASRDESAVLDEQGQLPTELAGTRVEINGKAASLVFVSPEQINCVIPADTVIGTADVLVRWERATVSRGEVVVEDVAPAVFTADASGAGQGAILNAITFAEEPFLVYAEQIPGDDQRTRLAVYGSGWRRADEVSAKVIANGGQETELDVEFAGEAPGFFGLDQANVVLPAELDGAGSVSLVVAADSAESNPVTFTIDALPLSDIKLGALSLASDAVRAGESVEAIVRLTGPAPTGGVSVVLSSDGPAAQVPSAVTISAGEVEASFTVSTSSAGPTGVVVVRASARGAERSQALNVRPTNAVDLTTVSFSPSRVAGGASTTGRIELSHPAPLEGLEIALRSDNAAVTVPGLGDRAVRPDIGGIPRYDLGR